jgi:hypothetical protein
MITLLTVTGGRPEAWALCKRWMAAQTVQPDRWIIVDDVGDVPEATIQVTPRWQPGQNTQARNLLSGLEAYEGGKLLIIEDDDYYSPNYIENMSKWLDRFDLVGERNALYYHVGQRVWRNCNNRTHASLCATGMSDVTKFVTICQKMSKFIDLELWKGGTGRLFDTQMTVGIKGLPGRPGIGAGHRMKGISDPNLSVLRKRIGSDSAAFAMYGN